MLPTTAVFKVTNASSRKLDDVKFYLDIGIPEIGVIMPNRRIKNYYPSISMTPKFVGISSNKGSLGGSIIVLNVQGVGSADAVSDITFTDAEGAD